MSITISQFRAASLGGEGKVAITNQGQVRTKGTGLQGRAVEWIRGKSGGGRQAKATENLNAKREFIQAIRKEYGDVMADRATHELGKHTSLKSRTIQAILKNADTHKKDFVRLHNVSMLEKQVASLLQKQGGLEAVYNSPGTAINVSKTFGLDLPKFDPKVAGEFMQDMLAQLPQDKPLEKVYLPGISDIEQSLGRAAVKDMWRRGEAGFGTEQFEQLLKVGEEPARILAGEKLLGIASIVSEECPSSKGEILKVVSALFKEAMSRDEGLGAALGVKGTSLGLLAPELLGVAESYLKKGMESQVPTEKIKFLCASEKCLQLRDQPMMRKELFQTMGSELEGFVRKHSKLSGEETPLKHPPNVERDRERLASIRKNMRNEELSLENTSEKFGRLIKDIYTQALEEFGVDVDSQTFILFGSGSRDEMFPFSDLEFAVLTDEPKDKVPQNLVKALEYFEMRITALGETPLGLDESIPIREGFCFDPGGNAPSSVRTAGTFLGTAQQVSKQIDPHNLILTEVFSSAKCLVGKEQRCQEYTSGVNQLFSSGSVNRGPSVGQQYAVNNLRDHLQKMGKQGSPIAKRDLSHLTSINAKEISRFPVFLASSLCKFHGVSSGITNTVDRLNELTRMGVLTEGEASSLKSAFEGFCGLRLKAEIHYQGQEHTILKEDKQDCLSLSSHEWQSMLRLLEPLKPIFDKITQFVESPGSTFLAQKK